MVNGTMPLRLTLLAAALLAAALFALQPYSADWPGRVYKKPAERYVRAALRQDSADLARLSASTGAVAWGLNVGREHPESLRLWSRHTRAWTGELRGDTVQVFLFPAGETCEKHPIVFRFVGSGSDSRVLEARSACLGT